MRKSISILLFVVMSCISVGAHAQGVSVIEHDGIESLLSTYVNYHKTNAMVKGYRVQIITTDDRRKMENALHKFRRLYPEIQSDWEHKVPYYQVKVGAFKHKLDYQGFLIDIKKDFPGSIPIVADIRKEELLSL